MAFEDLDDHLEEVFGTAVDRWPEQVAALAYRYEQIKADKREDMASRRLCQEYRRKEKNQQKEYKRRIKREKRRIKAERRKAWLANLQADRRKRKEKFARICKGGV